MQVSSRQLLALNGTFVVPPTDLVMERLSRLEKMLLNLSIPGAANADLTPVIARLDHIEGMLGQTPAPVKTDLGPIVERIAKLEAAIKADTAKGATYDFNVERNDKDKIVKVTATKVTSKTMMKG